MWKYYVRKRSCLNVDKKRQEWAKFYRDFCPINPSSAEGMCYIQEKTEQKIERLIKENEEDLGFYLAHVKDTEKIETLDGFVRWI